MLIRYILRTARKIESGTPNTHLNSSKRSVRKNTIFLVAMLDSPHFHSWLNSLKSQFPDRRIVLFPSDRPRFTRERKQHLKAKHENTVVLKFWLPWKLHLYLMAVLDKAFGLKWRSYFLARALIFFRPSVIHFHEMQHGAYIFNYISGYRKLAVNAQYVISTWGSDLSLYSWADNHQAHLKSSLHWADLLTAEKSQELVDANRLGFTGEFRAPVYIHVGVNENKLSHKLIPPSERKKILLKGYQGGPGRGLNGLHVISQNAKSLDGFEVLVFSADDPVRIQVDKLRNRDGLNIRCFSTTHDGMQEIFMSSRLSIGLSETDGLPASFVEAMTAGCFTIQSQNSAAQEFIVNGKNGFLVDPWGFNEINHAFVQALTNDQLVDSAVEINHEVLRSKYSLNEGLQNIRNIYNL